MVIRIVNSPCTMEHGPSWVTCDLQYTGSVGIWILNDWIIQLLRVEKPASNIFKPNYSITAWIAHGLKTYLFLGTKSTTSSNNTVQKQSDPQVGLSATVEQHVCQMLLFHQCLPTSFHELLIILLTEEISPLMSTAEVEFVELYRMMWMSTDVQQANRWILCFQTFPVFYSNNKHVSRYSFLWVQCLGSSPS